MRSPRFPLAGLMGLVLLCGLGLAALKEPSSLSAGLVFTTTATILLFAILASIRGRHRTFWLGFAVAGWGYGLLTLAPGSKDATRSYVLTDMALHWVLLWYHPELNQPQTVNLSNLTMNPPGAGGPSLRPFAYVPEAYLKIGHSLAALVHGFAGGIVLMLLAASESKAREGPGERPVSS